jgi:hypothetical protein
MAGFHITYHLSCDCDPAGEGHGFASAFACQKASICDFGPVTSAMPFVQCLGSLQNRLSSFEENRMGILASHHDGHICGSRESRNNDDRWILWCDFGQDECFADIFAMVAD